MAAEYPQIESAVRGGFLTEANEGMCLHLCLILGLAAFAFVTFCKKTSVRLLVPTFIEIESVQTTMTAFRTKIEPAGIISI
jgi:hypothetical protein